MPEAISSIHETLGALANSDLAEFRQFLRRLRKIFPEQAAEACLWYIASKGHDLAAESMTFWLGGDHVYIAVLLDPESLPPEMAAKAVAVVKDLDGQFLFKFVKATSELESPHAIMRALGLLPAIGDYSILIPWLRGLTMNADARVRSRSAKLLCELRPNKSLIDRQMQSNDPRVRATALEVLWRSNSEDARCLFRSALTDPHHRVVANALVGLYLQAENQVIRDQVMDEMIKHCARKEHLCRAAMAWAMAFVKDLRAIPTLQELTRDPSLVVRKRALTSLLLLESLKPVEPDQPAKPAEIKRSEPELPPIETPAAPIYEAPRLLTLR